MRNLWYSSKITHIKEQDNKTIIQIVVDGCHKENIIHYATAEGLNGELRLYDSRRITPEQNRKFHATIGDIAEYTGYPPEYTKEFFKYMFCYEAGIDPFSLSDCTVDVARELISYVIEFCIEHDVPLSELAIERTDDISKYLYYCIKHDKCCCCSQPSNTYTLPNKTKIALCNLHYDQAKAKGLSEFQKLQHVYGINFIG